MGKLHDLASLGQAVWFDFIQRSLISSGDLQDLIDQGVRGVTSNPTIFEKAIAGSHDYDDALKRLAKAGKSVDEIYEELVLRDIMLTADLFLSVYVRTRGLDGYVSLEVNPALAYDTDKTVQEAKRLFKTLGKPNVMIKVPATDAGIQAVEALIADGVNVNVTLLFSVNQYVKAAEAYLSGLEKYLATGGDIAKVASVASFFVSRVDTSVDAELERLGNRNLLGKAAIANAKIAYARFKEIFSGQRWERLAGKGAHVQRVLWASTGTKNPGYPDTLYVDKLIGPHTVNTLPPITLGAFLDHGHIASSLDSRLEQAEEEINELMKLGVDLDVITGKLEEDGVRLFSRSFESLLNSIKNKKNEVS
jgi:transaldolase